MSKECPLSYIKAVRCPGPVEVSRGHWLCPRQDGHCQNRLNGRAFQGSQPETFERPQGLEAFDQGLERAFNLTIDREP